ncbi:MAG: class I SAM-dependent methyltransferase, partial [Pseudomonadota bacterium]
KASGIDYLHYGWWHCSYAMMVSEATFQHTYDKPVVLDAGCACGALVKGFRNTGLYARAIGVDISSDLIEHGLRKWPELYSDLVVGNLKEIPLPDGYCSLVHSQQTLEHIPEEDAGFVVREFARVLRPAGRAFICLPVLKWGQPADTHDYDPTHVNIKPPTYWSSLLTQFGLVWDQEAQERYYRSVMKPGPHVGKTFFMAEEGWSVYALLKT